MEEIDETIARYHALNFVDNRLRFRQLIRVDIRLFHPLYDEEVDTRCDIWLGEEEPADLYQPQVPLLRVTMYGIEGGYTMNVLPGNRLNLDIKLIKDRHQWEHEARYLMVDLEDMERPVGVFACRTFEVSIEEVPFE
jgi:hypothetical protein